MKRFEFLVTCTLILLGLGSVTRAQTPPPTAPRAAFDFALIGDVPYNENDATNACPNLFADLNKHPLRFVVHDGDIKAGVTDCTDELFEDRLRLFQTSRHPFVFVFGDNEWSDCGKTKTKPMDPVERLAKLREIFCQGDRSLGVETIHLRRQSADQDFAAYRENVRWTEGGILFLTLNVPGSDNHYHSDEFATRNRANLAWLRAGFARATEDQNQAVMIIMQANPHFELAATHQSRLGFNEMLAAFEAETIAFGKPVVLVHGDTHYFRIDKPLFGTKSKRRLENFTRVETFGNPDVHWVRVSVDPTDSNVFTFRQQLVEANLLRQR